MVSYQDEIHARCLEAAGVVGAAPRHAWDRLATRLLEFQTHYENALTAVALEGYERRYDIDVPEVLGELPVDPTTGTSFGYLRLRDDPSHRPYVIYSYGRDGRDDGGTFDADRPWRAREPGWEGLDEPLTLPRHPRPVR